MSDMTTDQNITQGQNMAQSLSLTENAAKRIAWLMEQEEQSSLMLRIAVSGGGCSGFQYGFSFDDSTSPEDVTFEREGATVVIDQMSLELLNGSQVDFVEDLMGAYFKIENPNATASCGCGTSFAI